MNEDLSNPQPLLIQPGTNQFVRPQGTDGRIYLDAAASIELYCTKSFQAPFENVTLLLATCVRKDVFRIGQKDIRFAALTCKDHPAHSARRTGRKCYKGATEVEIGFEIKRGPLNSTFLRMMDLCHDEVIETTHYTHFNMTASSFAFQRGVSRPHFITGEFFEKRDVNQLYSVNGQRIAMEHLLGQSRVIDLFNGRRNFFLARGHMMAKADALFGAHQRGTFYFVNSAPQWQSFNGGNWAAVEDSVRRYLTENKINAEMYSGTYGISTLPDAFGKHVKLFLDIEGPIRRIPVPQLYYRIVLDKTTNRGIVLIGLNNPHLTLDEIIQNHILCEDVSHLLDWVSWVPSNISRGYSYACSVDSFVRAIDHLPKTITAKGLLL